MAGTYWYRLPDAGYPASILPRKPVGQYSKGPISIVTHKPRGIYTKGPVTSQGVRLSPAKPKPKTTYSLPQPKLNVPARRPAGAISATGSIQLPGASPSTLAAISGVRSNATLQKMAREAVMLEAQPQLNALGSAYNTENSNYGYLIGQLKKQLGLSTGDIKTLYDTLDASLGFNAKEQAKISADTKSKMGAIYDTLNQQIGTTYQNAETATSSELNRLGIVNPQANDKLTQTKALLQSQAQQSKANSGALQDAINASTQGMMAGMRAGSAATSAMLQSGLRGQFDKESGDALQQHLAKIADIKMQKATLSASLPSKINQTYQTLLDQQYQREMDAAQQIFDNQIKLGNLGVAQTNAAATQDYRTNQLALEQQKINIAKAKAATPAAKPLQGMDKALAYVQSIAKKSHLPYSTLENVLIEAINGDPRLVNDKPRLAAYDKTQMSAYGSDIQNFLNQRGMSSVYNDMLKAMQYWFGA